MKQYANIKKPYEIEWPLIPEFGISNLSSATNTGSIHHNHISIIRIYERQLQEQSLLWVYATDPLDKNIVQVCKRTPILQPIPFLNQTSLFLQIRKTSVKTKILFDNDVKTFK